MQIRTVYSSENINLKVAASNRKHSREPLTNANNGSSSKHRFTPSSCRATPNPSATLTSNGCKHSALAAAAYLASKFDAPPTPSSSNKNKVKEIHVGAKERSTKKFAEINSPAKLDDDRRIHHHDSQVRYLIKKYI